MLLQDNIFVSSTTGGVKYRVYLWINGPITTDQNYVGASYVGEIRAEVVSREDNTPPVNAAEYITNLYNNATKSTATVNNITYNLAPSVGLMNDRHASMSTDINGGDIRFYGANPNNYVWLGDSYTSDYTIPGNITSWGYADKAECIDDGNMEEECSEDTVRQAGDKKLWRIVGIFDGRIS